MSFPMRLPQAKRKIDYAFRTRLMWGGLGYTVGTFGVGEYLGWWDHFSPDYDSSKAWDVVAKSQEEDMATWRKLHMKLGHSLKTVETRSKMAADEFERTLPVGLKSFIAGPEQYDTRNMKKRFQALADEEVANNPNSWWSKWETWGLQRPKGKILVQENAPYVQPRYADPSEMISFTSSKVGETIIQNTTDPVEKEGSGLAAPEAAAEKDADEKAAAPEVAAPEVAAEEAVVESSAVEKTSGYVSPIRKSA